MFVVALSDTHGRHREVNTKLAAESCNPENCIVVHSGDMVQWPHFNQVIDFNVWMGSDPFMGSIPRQRKFVVLGNHDNVARYLPSDSELNFTLLRNTGCAVPFPGGRQLTIFGTTFQEPDEEWTSVLAACPTVDILVSHSPPNHDRRNDKHLRHAFRAMHPAENLERRLSISGHAHERYFHRESTSRPVVYIGASLSTSSGPLRDPLILPLSWR
ncbi:hypothetical protein Pelo_10044 [Pelomyxa schiedti]|nr:hypothetical protein Pelo_10044 [Pelomyxa schiedti]